MERGMRVPATIINGDARALPLPSASVDLVVTSPPYFLLRDYDAPEAQIGTEPTLSGYVNALLTCTAEMARVLTPKGSIFVNLGDKYNGYNANRGNGAIQRNDVRQTVLKGHGLDIKELRNKSLAGLPWRYALRCIDDLGLILRQEIIWDKPNGLPEQVKDRCRRSHETWFHFTKSDRYFFTPAAKGSSSVRRVPISPYRAPHGEAHPATFPPDWVRWAIDGWCPENGTVLDPFMGSGTALAVAQDMGRMSVGVELSPAYCSLARRRLEGLQ